MNLQQQTKNVVKNSLPKRFIKSPANNLNFIQDISNNLREADCKISSHWLYLKEFMFLIAQK